MSTPLSIAVIGIGFGQQVHLPAFAQNARCRVDMLCASDAARAERIARKLGIPRWSGDWQAVIADKAIDVVSIAVPAPLQARLVKAAASARKHVFCEKPPALDHATALSMLQAVDRANVVHGMNFLFAEIPEWQHARQLLEQGVLGRIRHVAVSWRTETYAFSKSATVNWKTRADAGGGALNSFASHSLYYLEWLFGTIRRLNGRLTCHADGSEAGVDCWFETAAGFVITLSVASDAFGGSGHNMEIYGSDGSLMLQNGTRDYVDGFTLKHIPRTGKALDFPPAGLTASGDGRVRAVSKIIDRFVGAIDDRVSVTPNLRHGVRVQYLIDQIRLSSKFDTWRNFAEPGE